MAVTATTSGRPPKPKKPKKTVVTTDFTKKTVIQREQKTPKTKYVAPKSTSPEKPIQNAFATVGAIVGETVAKGKSKTAKKVLERDKDTGDTKQVTLQREQSSKLREQKQERRERRQEAKAGGGGGKAKTYTAGPREGGSETRTKTGTRSKPKTDIFRSANQDRPGGGGGFKDIANYQTPASFDKLPDTRFLPLPGAGSEGGGGGGASVTGQSLSGLAGADLDTLLKGAKKGRRQKKRRGTE